jgi:hypothetical protein
VLVRGEGLKLSMPQYLIDQIASKANIQVLPFTQVVSADGEDRLSFNFHYSGQNRQSSGFAFYEDSGLRYTGVAA